MHQPITPEIAEGMLWDITYNNYDRSDEHVNNAILALMDDIQRALGARKDG